ncbi:MAG: 1-deoxy-D-xylulose-5-phosphate reductoisomerase [Candidatus Borkfalkiaceae bacterium]|nr:1-deoxy-D-xylulose-5-phosphate reductoisomerase [Clostridia bacterium]MDY6223965.1 1-deoxy-D-xylulose-5-phosphate reductoisomerase [Christensenellaceae bacterium]
MLKIALIGATGSIGRQTLSVIDKHPDRFTLYSAVSGRGGEAFAALINRYRPRFSAVADKAQGEKTRVLLTSDAPFYCGESEALRALYGCDIAVIAASGFAGLSYSLAAARLGLPIALANKETLVCGGEYFMNEARRHNVSIRPVDSEHSALWQALSFSFDTPFKKLIITASGGPFYGKTREELSRVTAEDALKHPTWKMGAKITVDSATLLNKGFEVIEAHHLYGAPFDKIHALVHPESVVHSMVQFEDGAVLAQLGVPSMELPIQLALTYPERLPCCEPVDFERLGALRFLPLEREKFPCFSVALAAGEAGDNFPCALNGAGEVAVHAFLRGGIGFLQIADCLSHVLDGTKRCKIDGDEALKETDALSRKKAEEYISRVSRA